MEELTTAALRFSTREFGAQCVMMSGILMMPTWCVVSLVFPAHLPLLTVHDTVKEQILCGWMMSSVMEERLHCLTVLITGGDKLAVIMARMQVWFVTLKFAINVAKSLRIDT